MKPKQIAMRYGDAPPLHHSWIIGSLQLFGWLVFHPSAWRHYVARLDPSLPPDFSLFHLPSSHFGKRNIRRLILRGCVICPLVWTALVLVVLLLIGAPSQRLFTAAIVGAVMGLLAALIAATTFSAAAALFCGFVGSLSGAFVNLEGGGFVPTGPRVGVLLLGLGIMSSALGIQAPKIGSQAGKWFSTGARVIVRIVAGLVIFALAFYILAYATSAIFGGAEKPSAGSIRNWGIAAQASFPYGIIVFLLARLRKRGWLTCLLLGVIYAIGTAAALYLRDSLLIADHGQAALPLRGLLYGVCNLPSIAILGFLYLIFRWLAIPRMGLWTIVALAAVMWLSMVSPLAALSHQRGKLMEISIGALLIGQFQTLWRPIILYPLTALWNFFLYTLDREVPRSPPRLSWHAAFWDEHQRLRQLGLDRHLVLIAELNADEGSAAMTQLATGRHRWAVQIAQVELDARSLERCTEVMTISIAHRHLGIGELDSPAKAILQGFSRISQDVDAALAQGTLYAQRLSLVSVAERLDNLVRELTRSSDHYAPRFYPIAQLWQRIVTRHIKLIEEDAEARQAIDCPYILGIPLTAQQEIFVGRTDICAHLEKLLVDKRRPPILLHGQRRMGKTSLLNNLGRILPRSVIPMFVDLQGPVTNAAGHAGFLFSLAREMRDGALKQRGLALPSIDREQFTQDPFTEFNGWLGKVEHDVVDGDFLLLLDEFETLEKALNDGRYDPNAILGLLRHVIQHRPRFKLVLAGSHKVEELARFATFLINVHVLEVSYLREDETRRLIEHPTKDFVLRYEPDAVQRVVSLTRGHPCLVQLLCTEIIALKNEQAPLRRRLVDLTDVENAIPAALEHGSFFFYDIEREQLDRSEVEILRLLANRGEGGTLALCELKKLPACDADRAIQTLRRRDLVEDAEGVIKFRVELIRRWFLKLGPARIQESPALLSQNVQ